VRFNVDKLAIPDGAAGSGKRFPAFDYILAICLLRAGF
jgi:hypothetical protein